MDSEQQRQAIIAGETALGIELGSTRIKAVLVDKDCKTLVTGSFEWENQLVNGIWTYEMEDAWKGIQTCYAQIREKIQTRYGVQLTKLGAIGISAMMHGYLPFDKDGKQLAGFRTWRNNITGEAADFLTEKFHFNIPQRWSIAHLFQAIRNGEGHVKELDFLTTLAGYVHWKLCGARVLGIGDASGMFPIDEATGDYDEKMLAVFDGFDDMKLFSWKLKSVLPKVLRAGEPAGTLTAEGARLLDVTGMLESGAVMVPPEGDAGTGMVSTNSVRKRTGNISVGTSAFSMNVLDAPLKAVHRDIDIVTTPDGAPVAMVHTNNCSSDINAWVGLFRELAGLLQKDVSSEEMYQLLFGATEKADRDAGGLLNYSCLSGENITHVEDGRPLFLRTPHSRMNLGNFMLAQLYGAFAPLKIGMDILVKEEQVAMDSMIAQGGLFKTPVVAQRVLADTLEVPITVMDTAGEGGPWGMAVLAVYAHWNKDKELADFLDQDVFGGAKRTTMEPNTVGSKGAARFMKRYRAGLSVEQEAGRTVEDTEK